MAIIGAGISGIAYADVLGRCGFEPVLFERAPRVGGVWERAYPEVSLQNSRDEYHLSSFPWPSPPTLHPTGAEIRRYLEEAVRARKLDVRLSHEVVSARAAGGGWDLAVRRDGETQAHRFDRLVVSIGQYSEGKHRPVLAGEETFSGRVLTERDVKDLSIFDGRRVVVVGFGKSALDMACFAAGRGAEVHHVFRTPRWTLSRSILGLHFTRLLFNRFGSVMMTSWTHPTAIERGMHRAKPIIQGFWSGLQALFRSIIRKAGRGAGDGAMARLDAVTPSHALITDLRSATALAPDDYYRLVATGRIQPHRAEVGELSSDGLTLSTGEALKCDLVMLSVGSRPPSFPFLADEARALLESEPDGAQLYRHLIHPRMPDVGFAGYNHSFMHVPGVEVGALWLAALWRGELTLPPVEEMEAAVEHIRAWKRANITFEPSRSCAVSTRFQQYLDILLQDLGVSPYRKLPNIFAEIFARYNAADYAGVVDEYLARPPRSPRRPVPLPT